MARSGPKLKKGAKRTQSGRISRSAEARGEMGDMERREAQNVVVLRRMRDKMRHEVTHPLFGFPLGQLALLEYITADELDAGRSWAELTFRHAQIIGLQLPKCRAIDWGGAGGRSLGNEPEDEHIERIKARKDESDAIIRKAGVGAMSEMTRVVILDEPPMDRPLLKRVLRELVDR